MATIVWQTGAKSCIQAWLCGRGSAADYGTPVTVPDGTATASNFGLGLGTRSGGVGSSTSDVMAQILEVGTTSAGGYARQSIQRSTTGWPDPTLSSGHYSTTASPAAFSFTGTPNPNGATLWFVAGSTTTNDDNCLFGADLSATRTYGSGDSSSVAPTLSI